MSAAGQRNLHRYSTITGAVPHIYFFIIRVCILRRQMCIASAAIIKIM